MTALRSKIQATWVLVMAAVALAGAGQAAESQSVTASSVEVPAAAFRLASGAMRPMQVDPAAEVLARLAASDAGQDAYLELARSYREALQPLEARTVLERASALFASPEVALEAARFFLAMGWTDRAWRVLDGAREDHPSDLGLLEAAAAVALASQRPEEAVTLLREAWAGGADRLAWLDDPLFANWRTQAPLRSMIDAELLASSLDGLDTGAQLDRLSVLAEVVTPGAAQAIVDVILTTDQPRVVRAGLWALARLGAAAEPAFAALLDRGDAWVRLETLRTIRTSGLETFATLLEQELEVEREAASFDLAQLALAELEARRGAVEAAERVLRGLPEANRYRHLALATLAGRYRIAGRDRAAAAVDAEAVELRRAKADLGKELDPVLERYHECKFRQDIAEVRQLLEHHKYVERIDARLYGLPEDDFDDQKSISIAERLMLRQIGEDEGWDMPVTGPIQYPREIPHFLRRYYAEHGTLPDCAAILEGWDEPEAVTLDWETKPNNDSSDDNETNIVVNPMDDRYVVGTANPSVGSANEVYRSSNYGATWTYDTVTPAGSYACDPVSYYSRIGSTDYLYHSFLTDCGSLCEVHMDYSVDNGDTWTACADVESTGNYDRQDHAIDLDPWGASSCANTVYVGYHSGTQYVRASSGSSAPYCQSWKSRGSGLSSTIGSAIVVATTGRAFNFYNQYSSGVKAMYTDNCGTSWGSSSSVADYNYDNFDWGIPSTCERTVYHYVQGDNDRVQGSPFRNRIYLTWNDLNTACSPPGCNGNTTCNDDVFVAVGTPDNPDSPTSWSWNTYNITDALTDDYTDEFYPSISVDQADGAVYLSYYRTNSGAGGIAPRRDEVHYVILRSVTGADSAAEWELLQVTAQPTCEAQGCGGNTWMQWGDYTWNDAVNGVAYAIWTDRRENADEDNWVGRICSEPAHWSERGNSPTTPATGCADHGDGTVDITWAAPDIDNYAGTDTVWGDGGENQSLRKYELWRDGSRVVDGISWGSSALNHGPGDAADHTYFIRAVNSCGVAKDWGQVVCAAGGGASADLEVRKTDGACYVLPGSPVTYNIRVVNKGPSGVSGATVTDLFPAEIAGVTWSCSASAGASCMPDGAGNINDTVSLPSGSMLVYTATGTVVSGASGQLTNTVTVAPPTGVSDPVVENNGAADVDGLEPPVFCDDFESGDSSSWSATVG